MAALNEMNERIRQVKVQLRERMKNNRVRDVSVNEAFVWPTANIGHQQQQTDVMMFYTRVGNLSYCKGPLGYVEHQSRTTQYYQTKNYLAIFGPSIVL